jgi:hypothetical protein
LSFALQSRNQRRKHGRRDERARRRRVKEKCRKMDGDSSGSNSDSDSDSSDSDSSKGEVDRDDQDEEEDVEVQPCQMFCFVDLRCLPEKNDREDTQPGIHALVKMASEVTTKKEQSRSDLLVPFTKTERIHLVEVGKIREPICMIPDIANKDKFSYFTVIRKKHWAQGFKE